VYSVRKNKTKNQKETEMKNKKKNKIKRTPEQKRMLWKKQHEKMKQNIQLRKDLENQRKLERKRMVDEIKGKMKMIPDTGMLYHVTTQDSANSILNNGLQGGNSRITHRYNEDDSLCHDTYGKIYFIDSDNPRLWNGCVVEYISPSGLDKGVEELAKKTNSITFWDEKSKYLKERFEIEEYVVFGIPKSYFKVKGIEIIDDDCVEDLCNANQEQKFVETNVIEGEFLSVVHIFKPDYDDWDFHYKWELVPLTIDISMKERLKHKRMTSEQVEFLVKKMKERIYLESGIDWNGDWKTLPKEYGFYNDNGWERIIYYHERYKYCRMNEINPDNQKRRHNDFVKNNPNYTNVFSTTNMELKLVA
jgi:hypothetical protein